MHGATYPAETAFDLPIEGVSMMDLIAMRGYDVYLVDIRGYGRSTRPPEMSQPPEANKPIVSTKVAAARSWRGGRLHPAQARGSTRINLMGWSWGTSIAGSYTSEHNDKISKLVLYAPQWILRNDAVIARRRGRQEPAARRLPAGVEGSRQGPLAERRRLRTSRPT